MIVMTAEQAETLMPLTMYEYDAINKMDMWQEMWGEDDIGELDNAVTAIFCDPEARKLIGEHALKGEYLELAGNIGVADELGNEIEETEEDESIVYYAVLRILHCIRRESGRVSQLED